MGRRKFKRKVIENLTITGIADKGKGVARDETGRVIFVDDVAPGDVVDVLIYKKRKAYLQGSVQKTVKYSDDRVEPFCEHFGTCGGCKFQHIPYEKQIEYKQDIVDNALRRIGKVEIGEFKDILPCEEPSHYRNKLEFSFSNKRWLTYEELNNSEISNVEDVLGFHRAGAFDKILNINECHLQVEPTNQLRNSMKEIAIEQGHTFYDVRKNTGFLRNMIVRITTTGEVMLLLSVGIDDRAQIDNYLNAVLEKNPSLTCVYFTVNKKVNDSWGDLEMVHFYGKKSIEEYLGKVKFEIGPKSFFQTNTKQAVRLFDVVKEFAELSGEENVYDLYTGLGSIGLYLADQCKQVVGIEEIAAAIEDAKENCKRNNIDNAVFYAGDVKDILTTEFSEKHGKPDVVITDPPRVGMHPKVVEMLLELEAPKIVYVSCKPSTQARDLNLLSEKYDVMKVQPVDMFPQTHHIETVALLVKRVSKPE